VDIDTIQAIASIGSQITTSAVLLAWVFYSERRRTFLAEKILDDWEDMRRLRISLQEKKQLENIPEQA